MKGDFSRITFDKSKNFNRVLEQQGRVSLDADKNESMDIIAHRRRNRTKDSIGYQGAPMHDGGFEIMLSADSNPDNLLISTGRIYVNGLLCELHPGARIPILNFPVGSKVIEVSELNVDGNALAVDQWVLATSADSKSRIVARITKIDKKTRTLTLSEDVSSLKEKSEPFLRRLIPYSQQVDNPIAKDKPLEAGQNGLIYLDVWERHMTAIEDPYLRDEALGGIDTTTRIQTIAQVKLLPFEGEGSCSKAFQSLNDSFPPSGGRMKSKEKPDKTSKDPCLLTEEGGYRGLENRLYRVEIHEGGDLGSATFKWSRDNGSNVYEIKEFVSSPGDGTQCKSIRLNQVGRDRRLRINPSEWIEITDNNIDLDVDHAGEIVQIDKVEENGLLLILKNKVNQLEEKENPKVRRWDVGLDTKTFPTKTKAGYIELEDGVQIGFSGGNFKVGDYWVFTARSATGKVETLEDEPPLGITHHYAPLAIITWIKENNSWKAKVQDCRSIFPPVTELINFFYLGGDGQEAMPGAELSRPLCVGVSNGRWPVADALVEFKVEPGTGALQIGGKGILQEISNDNKRLVVKTDAEGMAECRWTLDGTHLSQQVKAELLNAADERIHLPIFFNANLSTADNLYYDPKGCDKLDNKVNTVQQAIDGLCQLERGGGGCAITVGEDGGQYPTLQKAFSELKDKENICLCLLPGLHIVKDEIPEIEKNSIRITGCGSHSSIIDFNSEKISFIAREIVFQDFSFRVNKPEGTIILSGNKVTAERCTFIRVRGKGQPSPLVLIKPVESFNTLYFKNNNIESPWEYPIEVGIFLPPVVELPQAVRTNFEKLVKIDPDKERNKFSETLKVVISYIRELPPEVRMTWSKKRPLGRIADLQTDQMAVILKYYDILGLETLSDQRLRAGIEPVLKNRYLSGYATALALGKGVGGFLVDNVILGSTDIFYNSKFVELDLNNLPGGKLNYVLKYLPVDPVKLHLRGNVLMRVQSNNYWIDQIEEEKTNLGYSAVFMTENQFERNNNSIICKSLMMNGNHYSAATKPEDLAATVVGHTGVFVGNIAPDKAAFIRHTIDPGLKEIAANLVKIS